MQREDRSDAWSAYSEIIDAVGRAKNEGYVPEGKLYPVQSLITREAFHAKLEDRPTPFVAKIIDDLLLLSVKTAFAGGIDFNDQIYMPTMFGGAFPRYPRVMVDECQDLNRVNHAMLRKWKGSWLASVGDPWQSIYAFRGAIRGGMDTIATDFSTKPFRLTESFRCPRAIVEAAKWRVPDYRTNKPGGRYDVLAKLKAEEIPNEATFICRNNAPLFSLAFKLLRTGRRVKISGSDIGPKLTRIMKKLGDDNMPRDRLLGAIRDWEDRKMETAQSTDSIRDQAECMRVFAHYGRTLGEAIAYIEQLFKQDGTIQLTTGHKAKGKEWNYVYFLDPWLIGQDDQDLNLKYVIQTRALDTCLEINSAAIEVGE
jgi:hypothetical protein